MRAAKRLRDRAHDVSGCNGRSSWRSSASSLSRSWGIRLVTPTRAPSHGSAASRSWRGRSATRTPSPSCIFERVGLGAHPSVERRLTFSSARPVSPTRRWLKRSPHGARAPRSQPARLDFPRASGWRPSIPRKEVHARGHSDPRFAASVKWRPSSRSVRILPGWISDLLPSFDNRRKRSETDRCAPAGDSLAPCQYSGPRIRAGRIGLPSAEAAGRVRHAADRLPLALHVAMDRSEPEDCAASPQRDYASNRRLSLPVEGSGSAAARTAGLACRYVYPHSSLQARQNLCVAS